MDLVKYDLAIEEYQKNPVTYSIEDVRSILKQGEAWEPQEEID